MEDITNRFTSRVYSFVLSELESVLLFPDLSQHVIRESRFDHPLMRTYDRVMLASQYHRVTDVTTA